MMKLVKLSMKTMTQNLKFLSNSISTITKVKVTTVVILILNLILKEILKSLKLVLIHIQLTYSIDNVENEENLNETSHKVIQK